ncbi:MAG TPA: lysophospholipid acyltransferase family protein [Polyangiales bacterium]|nr:lysophospholipid acyltransferase family protein [Polyangiales bacterium]
MQTDRIRSLPDLGVKRAGSRAARIGAFAIELWSRGIVDGAARSAEERARELTWIAENMVALHGVRPCVRGVLPTQPSLLVANHMSYFDPVVMSSLLPLTAVAKQEVGSWPVIGEQCKRYGVLWYERENALSGARVLREAMRALERGVSVLVFPEGTTTYGESVLPFKRGSFGAALHAGVPIVPVALRYESPSAAWVGDQAFLSHYVRAVSKRYTRVSVEFLPALSQGTPSELAEEARRAIERALHSGERRHVSRFADVGTALTA